jgi:CheY-like chemotaxis protein
MTAKLALLPSRTARSALACFLYYIGAGDETMMTTRNVQTPTTVSSNSQQVVEVSKQSQLNGLLETVLDAGQYDVVFVESTEHAYSHIKRLTPHLIIVCLDIDDLDGFQVLSMLKLDDETKRIPVVTCTVSHDEEETHEQSLDPQDDVFSQSAVMQLN